MKRKLNCENFELRIHRLLDDRLTLTGDPMLMEHAAICAGCGQLVKDYESIDSSLSQLILESQWGQDHPISRKRDPAKFADRSLSRVGFAAAIAAALLLVFGIFSFQDNELSPNRNVSSLRFPAPTTVATANPQVLSNTSPSLAKNRMRRSGERPERFVHKLVFSRPPTTILELAQTAPEFVNSVRLPSSGWDRLSVQLDPLHSYLQYSVEIPGIRIIQCSVAMTLDLLQRSFSKPEKSEKNLGWFPETPLYALA